MKVTLDTKPQFTPFSIVLTFEHAYEAEAFGAILNHNSILDAMEGIANRQSGTLDGALSKIRKAIGDHVDYAQHHAAICSALKP